MAEAGSVTLSTARGAYRLTIAQVAAAPDSFLVTLSLQHQGGLEKFALIYCLARALAPVTSSGELDQARFAQRLGPWLEPQFENVREAALKSIRTEHRLLEVALQAGGPF